jgi:hypothetical protein
MYVGQDWTAKGITHLDQNLQPLFHPNAALGGNRRPVCLVIAGFENKLGPRGRTGSGDFFGHEHCVIAAFQLTRACDQGNGRVATDDNIADCDFFGV